MRISIIGKPSLKCIKRMNSLFNIMSYIFFIKTMMLIGGTKVIFTQQLHSFGVPFFSRQSGTKSIPL